MAEEYLNPQQREVCSLEVYANAYLRNKYPYLSIAISGKPISFSTNVQIFLTGVDYSPLTLFVGESTNCKRSRMEAWIDQYAKG